MPENIQALLNTLAQERADKRLHLFEVKLISLEAEQVTLGGRVLTAEDLQALTQNFSQQYPGLRVETSGIQVLRQPGNPVFAVGTNLTSLHQSTSFLSELSSQMVFGERVEILEETGRWVFVRQMDGYLGWTYKPYLTDAVLPAPTHISLAPAVELRAEPGPQAAVLSRVFCGTRLAVLETQGAWAKVAAHLTGWLPLADLRALADLPKTEAARRAQILADAGRLVGVPYLWGGTTGNGIDCSGYARLLQRWVGLEIPRDADLQSKQSQRIEPPYQPGDLFFFGEGDSPDRQITHVGVCLGGTLVMHSSRSRNGVYLDDLEENAFLREILVHAGTFLRR